MIFYPQRNFLHINAVRCHVQPETYQFFLRVRQIHAVLAKNQQQRRHANALVSVHKAMILHQPATDSGRFFLKTRPYVYAAEQRSRAVQRAFNQRKRAHAVRAARPGNQFSCSRKTCCTDGSQALIWPVSQMQASSR